MLKGFFKPSSRLYNQATSGGSLLDILGGTYSVNTFDSGVKIDKTTEGTFTDVIDTSSSFWGAYYQ